MFGKALELANYEKETTLLWLQNPKNENARYFTNMDAAPVEPDLKTNHNQKSDCLKVKVNKLEKQK